MKFLITVLIGLIVFILGFWLSAEIIDQIVHLIPKAYSEWYGFLKFIIWFFSISAIFGVSFFIALLVGALVQDLID